MKGSVSDGLRLYNTYLPVQLLYELKDTRVNRDLKSCSMIVSNGVQYVAHNGDNSNFC